jgi:preprotein translocase subunit SecG
MIISLLIVVAVALVGHVLVSTAVDSYNGYGDNGPDFRL